MRIFPGSSVLLSVIFMGHNKCYCGIIYILIGGDTMLSEIFDQNVVVFPFLSGIMQGLSILFKCIIENPLLIVLAILSLVCAVLKVKRK